MIHHHQRIARTAGLTLALTAIAASPASAMPPAAPASPGPCSEVCSGGGYSSQSKSLEPRSRTPVAVYSRQDKSVQPETLPSSGPERKTTVSTPQPIVRIVAPNGGFDWGDAGIGAAAGLGLASIGVGAALGLTHRRARGSMATRP